MFGRSRIGEILLSHGLVTQEQLASALEQQQLDSGKKLGAILIEQKFVKEIDILRALGLQFGIEVWETFDLEQVDMTLSKDYNYNVAMSQYIMPFQMRGNFVLTALTDPLNTDGIDYIRVLTGFEPIPILAPQKAVHALITGIYDKRGDLNNMVDDLETKKPVGEEEEAQNIEDILNHAASDDEARSSD